MPPWLVIEEDSNSKVNPPTDQKLLIGEVVVKFHAPGANATAVPGVIANTLGTAKTPESSVTWGLIHDVTAVAVAVDELFNVAPPVNPMLPAIGTAYGT